jgi:hypothetical protein
MVTCGLWILPRGVVDRAVGRTCVRCLTAATAMAVVGFVSRGAPIIAIPAAVATYVAILWFGREMDSDLLLLLPPWLSNRVRFLQRSSVGP